MKAKVARDAGDLTSPVNHQIQVEQARLLRPILDLVGSRDGKPRP
jgi:hypothetical protein